MTWLLLLTLALRALLAPGMMPDFARDTGVMITICTAQGARTLSPEDGTGGHAAHAEAPCLFAATGFANLGAVTGPVLSAPVEWMPFNPVSIADTGPARFGPDRAHARGPPAGIVLSSLPGSNA